MKRLSLSIVLVVAACGAETPTKDQTAASPAPTVQGGQPQKASSVTSAPAGSVAAPETEETSLAFAVAAASRLPACEAARDGAIAYVKDSGRLLACSGGNWIEAPVRSGVDGVDGLAGKDGKDGKDGVTAALDVVPAEAEACAAGGVLVTPYFDKDGDGSRSASDPAGTARTLCDGLEGAEGAAGEAGAVGEAGAAGEAGAKGDKGETGAAGATGDKGEDGAVGATGSQGATGATGSQGATGAAGADGNDNHIVATYVCTGLVYSNKMSNGTPLNLSSRYKAVVLSSGDVRASAQLYWADLPGLPAGYSLPFAEDYAAGNGLAATAVVTGLQNWVIGSTSGTWTWTLDRVSTSVAVRYDDADMNPTWTTFSHVCTRTTY